jgi:uncharacterized protein
MTRVHPALSITEKELETFCQKWEFRELALFGSAARDQLRPESDVDFLIEFKPTARIGLIKYFELQDELARIVGRPVDLVSKEALRNPYRRASIMRDLTPLYAA